MHQNFPCLIWTTNWINYGVGRHIYYSYLGKKIKVICKHLLLFIILFKNYSKLEKNYSCAVFISFYYFGCSYEHSSCLFGLYAKLIITCKLMKWKWLEFLVAKKLRVTVDPAFRLNAFPTRMASVIFISNNDLI